MAPYYPIDWHAIDEERHRANVQRNIERNQRMSGTYDIPPEVLARTHTVITALGRKARRRLHRDAAELNLLAVLDPASGATTRDRLTAAAECAKIAGLTRESKQSVDVTFTVRGWGPAPSPVLDVPATVVTALPTSATPVVPATAVPTDGARTDEGGGA